MNKLVKGIVAVAAVVAVTPALAHAGDDTTTTVYEVPEQCAIDVELYPGPARAAHQVTGDDSWIEWCYNIDGICVVIDYGGDGGPARIAHRTSGGDDPCVPVGEACDFELEADDILDVGPARRAHQPAARPAGDSYHYIFDIPEECQEALSQAFGPTGRESGTIAWIAALLVGVGGVLLVTRRTIAIRTR
jgi:hypothetical protein